MPKKTTYPCIAFARDAFLRICGRRLPEGVITGKLVSIVRRFRRDVRYRFYSLRLAKRKKVADCRLRFANRQRRLHFHPRVFCKFRRDQKEGCSSRACEEAHFFSLSRNICVSPRRPQDDTANRCFFRQWHHICPRNVAPRRNISRS